MLTGALFLAACLCLCVARIYQEDLSNSPDRLFLSTWEDELAGLLSAAPDLLPAATTSPTHTAEEDEQLSTVGSRSSGGSVGGGPGAATAAQRHAVRQRGAWLAVRRRAPLLLAILEARLAGIRAHMDILRHTLDLEQELQQQSTDSKHSEPLEQLGSRRQLLEQLGGQLAAEGRAIVEDLLELRQLYANLRRFFGAGGGRQGRREADPAAAVVPPSFLCHNVSHGLAGADAANVHQLRPQDIGILGSLGDSLTAGTAAAATSMMDVFDESRGLSFITGADGHWQNNPTLGNFLKAFNPFIQGTSLGTERASLLPFRSESRDGGRGLNLATTGTIAKDLPGLAGSLVRKVQAVPLWGEEWKLVTIMVGQADLCAHSCNATLKQEGVGFGVEASGQAYAKSVEKAVDILRSNLNRTLVVLISPADISSILTMPGRPTTCALAQFLECPCFYEDSVEGNTRRFRDLAQAYNTGLQDIAALPKFHGDDFSVVYLPLVGPDLVQELGLGTSMQQAMDEGLVAPDCLNLASKAQGRLAQRLWNLLFPRGKSEKDAVSGIQLNCPTESSPFMEAGQTRGSSS